MDKTLAELIKISNATGKDPSLVQGGGGNTSVKTDDGKFMYIKASGTALKDMNAKAGWRRLRLDNVREIIRDRRLEGIATDVREAQVVNRLCMACDDEIISNARPSVEAHLHAFLDKCVIHLHPEVVLCYACAKNGEKEIKRLFKDFKLPPLWVPFSNPGISLAKKVDKLVIEYEKKYKAKPSVMFLQKHGLFISAKNSKTALSLLNLVIKRCSVKLNFSKKTKTIKTGNNNEVKLRIRKAFYEATRKYSAVSCYCDETILSFGKRIDAGKLLSCGAMTPDELVYAGGPPVWIDNQIRKSSQVNNNGIHNLSYLVKDSGLFVAATGSLGETIKDLISRSLFIRANAAGLGGVLGLNKAEEDFINKWESEAFRKNLAAGLGNGQVQGQIAVVTGSGSGLGKSIAIGLAKAGALVALVDIDKKEVQKTAEKLKNFQTLVVQCDVKNEKSVENTFGAVLDKWGGLDILVNAAGIAPPFGLIDMPADKWRTALDVNLTGYFLMAKAAAKILIQQGMGGNIINLSSKSGLEASKNNTAYTTTKAGELAMARGWAMELGEYGIRVNSVCPGNVFEGSKIWNPHYIKECAKKNKIKPEEVIPFYVNKTALKREIKGQDIADAIVFLCSDKARTITGQTLVADSGQVMVR